MKAFLKLIIGIGLLAYLVLAITKFRKAENTEACKRVVIEVTDSNHAAFITVNELEKLLVKKGLYPQGIPMNNIQSGKIEEALESHQFILDAQCYKTADNVFHIKVSQRLPIMRIISINGQNYYIDGKGNAISHIKLPADVIVATGAITTRYAKKYLAPIGRILQNDEFWNSQIVQLNVQKEGSIELIPRVGNHIVKLGVPLNTEKKLQHLKYFYQEVLNEVGWNKYSTINMEFENQIVCTKKE